MHDESASIAVRLRDFWSALSSTDQEVLGVYGCASDSALLAIAAMPDRLQSLHLVENTFGRGTLNAIRTSFATAQGDVVVMSVAGPPDPPELILRMDEATRSGADVVAGSRYMHGGTKIVGPHLKHILSRIARLSIHGIARVGARDATRRLRTYLHSFFERVETESRRGFGLALTVKAHLAGRRVAEVPCSRVDGPAEASRFRMWRSMPSHPRRCSRAMAAPVLVGLAWVGMLAYAHNFVATYASPIPYVDDLSIVSSLATGTELSPTWLWSQHNEHRIPLPRLVMVGLMHLTHDFRSLMYTQVYILAAASLGLILVARRIRGRTSLTDAFFPFLFMHLGHSHNLLMGFQIALVLPTALSAAVLMLVAGGPPFPDRRSGLLIGACVVAMPLCGAAGLLQVPALATWIGLAGIYGWRSVDPARRRSAPLLVAVAAASAIVVALYFVGYRTPPSNTARSSIAETVLLSRRIVGMSAGLPGMHSESIAGILLAGLSLSTVWLSLATARSRPDERWRVFGLLACACAVLVLAIAIAWGRGEMPGGAIWAWRYVTLVSPFPACLYLVWCRYGTKTAGRLVLATFCIGMGALVPAYVRPAQEFASGRLGAASSLARDVEAGFLPNQLAERHWRGFLPTEDGFAFALRQLRALGLPPYRRQAADDAPATEIARVFSFWDSKPIETRSDQPISLRKIDGVRVVLVHAPGEIVLKIPPGVRRLSGRFGVHPLAYQTPGKETDGVRFSVECLLDPGEPAVQFERVLDPVSHASDTGFHDFAIDLPSGASGRIVLRVEDRPGGSNKMDWGFWTGIDFE